MITVTADQARKRFAKLLESASRGERVVVTRKGKPLAEIRAPETGNCDDNWMLTDEEADKLNRLIAENEASGKTRSFESVEAMVEYLRKRAKIPKKALKR